MALRYDRGTLRPPKRLANGSIRVDAYLTRTGVFEYLNPDGSIRREYRDASEVFAEDSLESFEGVTITDDHPSEPVSANNARAVSVGTLQGAPRRDGDHVAATMIVFDAATIAKLERGKRELSCGYECELVEEPGVSPSGERYDARQTKIRGNHVAIVDYARAGRTARARMDAAEMVASTERQDGAERALPMDELKKALEQAAAEKARADAAEQRIKVLETEANAQRARADGLDKELAAERKARTDAAADVPKLVASRVALQAAAVTVLGDDYRFDGTSDRDIKIAVVKKVDEDDLPADSHDAYVDGRYVAALKQAGRRDSALGALRLATVESRGTDPRNDAVKAREDFERRMNAAGTEKLS
jgi:uncharacterized protein